MAEQARWKNARIVHDEEIARIEITAEFRECRVLDVRVAAQYEQPGAAPLFGRMLGNQRLGQLEVEIRNVHLRHGPQRRRSPKKHFYLCVSAARDLQFSRTCSTSSLSVAVRPG